MVPRRLDPVKKCRALLARRAAGCRAARPCSVAPPLENTFDRWVGVPNESPEQGGSARQEPGQRGVPDGLRSVGEVQGRTAGARPIRGAPPQAGTVEPPDPPERSPRGRPPRPTGGPPTILVSPRGFDRLTIEVRAVYDRRRRRSARVLGERHASLTKLRESVKRITSELAHQLRETMQIHNK